MKDLLREAARKHTLSSEKEDALNRAVARVSAQMETTSTRVKDHLDYLNKSQPAFDAWSERNDKLWVSDYERENPSLGTWATQAYTGFMEGGAELAGTIFSAVPSIKAGADIEHLLRNGSPAAMAAINKALQGEQLTPDEIALLDSEVPKSQAEEALDVPFESYAEDAPAQPDKKPRATHRDYIENALGELANAKSIEDWWTKDTWIEGAFNDAGVGEYQEQLGETFDQSGWNEAEGTWDHTKAIGSLVGGWAVDTFNNPMAVTELMAQEGADIVGAALTGGTGAAVLLGASAVGEATRIYREGLEAYMKENGGKLPDVDLHKDMVQASLAAGALELAGDSAIVAGLKGSVAKSLKNIAGDGIAARAFGKTLGVLGGTATEAGTEGTQNVLSKLAEGKTLEDVSARDVFIDAGMGASVGGGFATVGAVGESFSDAKELKQQRTIDLQNKIYSDVTSPDNTERAPLSETLSLKKGLKDLPIINSIAAKLALDVRNADLDHSDSAKQNAEQFATDLMDVHAELARQLDQANAEPKPKEKRINEIRAAIDQVEATILDLYAVAAFDTERLNAEAEDTDLNIAFEDARAEGVQKAVIQSITTDGRYAERVLEHMTPEQLGEFKNGLTPTDRRYVDTWHEAFQTKNAVLDSQAKRQQKDRIQVNNEIIHGGRGKKGLIEYNQDITGHVNGNRPDEARDSLKRLIKFRDQQAAKQEQLEAAYEEAKRTGKTVTVERETLDGKPYEISVGRSRPLLDDIGLELKAINAQLKASKEQLNRFGMLDSDLDVEVDEASAPSAEAETTETTPKTKTHKSQQRKKDAPPSPPVSAYEDQANSVETTEPTPDPETETQDDDGPALEDTAEPTAPEPEEAASSAISDDAPRNDDGSLDFVNEEIPLDYDEDYFPVDSDEDTGSEEPEPTPTIEVEELTEQDRKREAAANKIREEMKKLQNRIDAIRVKQNNFDTQYKAAKAKNRRLTKAEFSAELNEEIERLRKAIGEQRTKLANRLGLRNEPSAEIAKALTTLSDEDKKLIRLSRVNADALPAGVKTLTAKQLFEQVNNFARYMRVKSVTLLNSVPNALSELASKPAIAYFFTDKALDAKHKTILRNFSEFSQEHLIPAFDALYKSAEANNGKRAHHMLTYLEDENGEIPANVKAALSATIYQWMLTDAKGSLYRTESQAAGLLTGDTNGLILKEDYLAVANAGMTKGMMISKLGKSALDMLGVKATKDAPKNIQQRIELALGQMALQMMNEANLLEHTFVDVSLFAESDVLTDEEQYGDTDKVSMFRASTDPSKRRGLKRELHPVIEAIVELNRDSGSFFQRVFDTTHKDRMPSFKEPYYPENLEPEFYKGTSQKLPKKVVENKQNYEKQAWIVSPHQAAIWNGLSTDQKLAMNGYNFEADREEERHKAGEPLQTIHISNLKGELAKNEQIRRDLEAFEEFVQGINQEGDPQTPFYFRMEVWKQGRIGIVGSTINPMAKKLQRGLITNTGWNTTIDPSNDKHIANLNMAIGLALGLKNGKKKGVDKLSKAETTQLLNEALSENTNGLQDAVTAMIAIQSGVGTPEDYQTVTDAVAAFGEGTHSLQGIVALAQRENASGPFETDIPYEIDGATNGVIIAAITLISRDSPLLRKILQKGAVFFNGEQSFAELIANGLDDAYESLGIQWQGAMQRGLQKRPELSDYVNTVGKYFDIFDKEGTGKNRALFKDPLMRTLYGSGVKAMNLLIGNQLIYGSIVPRIEEIVSSNQTEEEKREALAELQADLQIMADSDEPLAFDLTKVENVEDALLLEMDNNTESRIRNNFSNTFGATLQAAIQTEYKELTMKREQYNNLYTAASALYKIEFERLVAERLKTLNNKRVIYAKFEDLPPEEIKAIEEKLIDIHPSAKTMFATDPSEYISLLKTGKTRTDAVQYTHKLALNKKVAYEPADGKESNAKNAASHIESTGKKPVIVDPGMGSAVLGIQNTDAAVASLFTGLWDVLGVHDGFFVSTANFDEAGEQLNAFFAQAVAAQGMAARALDMGARMQDYINNSDHPKQLEREIELQINQWLPEGAHNAIDAGLATAPSDYVTMAMAIFKKAEGQLSDLLTKITGFQQYVTPEGIHNTGNTPQPLPKETAKPKAKAKAEPKPAVTPKPNRQPPPILTSDPSKIQDLFNGQKSIPVTELLKGMEPLLKEYPIWRSVGKHLADMLKDANVNVEIVSPTDRPDWVEMGALGSYSRTDNVIRLANTEFGQAHGLNIETVLHEMMHASVTRLIVSQKRNKYARDTIKNLESILEAVRQHVKENPEDAALINSIGSNVLDNIDELLAWGFTNPEFQQLLKRVEMKAPTGKIMKAWENFVRTIQKAIFGSTLAADSSHMHSAMNELLTHGTDLMAAAKLARDRNDPTPPAESLLAHNYGAPNWQESFMATHNRVQGLTPDQLLAALHKPSDTTSTAHQQYLGTLVHDLTNLIGGTMGIDLKEAEGMLGNTTEQFIRRMADNDVPFVSSLSTVFNLSDQEAYAAGISEIVFRELLGESSDVREEVERLWNLSKDALSPADFNSQAEYDALFKPVSEPISKEWSATANKVIAEERSLHLERFLAMAVASQRVREVLSNIEAETPDQPSGDTLLEQIGDVFKRIVRFLRVLVSPALRAGGDNVDARLTNILRHTAELNAKQRMILERKPNLVEQVEDKFNEQSARVRKKIVDITDRRRESDVRIPIIDPLAHAIGMIANEEGEALKTVMHEVRTRMISNPKYGSIATMLQSVTGGRLDLQPFYNMLRWIKRDNERQREHMRQTTRNIIRDAFIEPLSREESASLGHVLLRTDLQAITNGVHGLNANKLRALINPNDPALEAEIQTLVGQLKQLDPDMAQFWADQAHGLGIVMIDRIALGPNQLLNAKVIAKGWQSSKRPSKEISAKAEPIIDTLASLHALSRVKDEDRKRALQVLDREFKADETTNGITSVLGHAQRLRQESLEKNFSNGGDYNMVKGFTGETNDNRVSTKLIPEHELKNYIQQGWTPQGHPHHKPMYKDPGDPNSVGMYHVYRRDGGQQSWLSGLISFSQKQRMGTTIPEGMQNAGNGDAFIRSQKTIGQVAKAHARSSFDPNGDQKFAVPVFNAKGQVETYRYLMNTETKEQVLNAQYDVAEMMGNHEASIIDKVATENSNNEVIDLLHKQYYADWDKGVNFTREYVELSATSSDPVMRELWNRLPYEAKQKVISMFGRPALPIRGDVVTLVTGYRKFSITDPVIFALETKVEDRSVLIHAAVKALEFMSFGDVAKTISRLKHAEDIWQEIMRGIKDILVIKNVFTLMWNIVSNTALLVWSGMSPTQAVKQQGLGAKYALEYEKHERELTTLQARIDAGLIPKSKLPKAKDRVAELKNSLATNKVKKLIDAGVYQSIIEDVDQTEDQFSYASRLEDATAGFTDRVPRPLKNIAKVMWLHHDTTAYKVLNKTTQLSDFSARYAKFLYLTQGRNPISEEEAIKIIMEDFVQYDIPDGKALQYMNDMGLVMFSKYYLRMQRTLVRLFKENPLRGLLLVSGQTLGEISDPTDSVLWTKGLGDWFLNPFSTLFGSLDEPAPVNATLHAFGAK